ncbi:phenol hydroxylase P0 protein [Collimonas sp. OK607]|uniref:phenol hydroxylase subunit n=1 Tax=Collimonas sp. OK607 TaxID=1798194 RepID=UPI0008EE4044|nr:phenol hydroxylase subunit [Collimonas sp. OK607]SFB34990.1 phenol hydroxylase P0 protein [Collimonas sp. OK607]
MERNNFDTTRKFVRVIELKKNGMVEFEFAVGEPELYVEMLLPAKAFEEFSAANHVVTLDATSPLQIAAQESVEDTQWSWSLHQARNSASNK